MDQLIPVTLAGKNYLIVPGYNNFLLNGSNYDRYGYAPGYRYGDREGDFAYIVATEANTTVKVVAGPRNVGRTFTLAKAGDQLCLHTASARGIATAISASQPVMVYHLGGVPDQKGGAILPALPEEGQCVGSKATVFSVPYNAYKLAISILAWDQVKTFPVGSTSTTLPGAIGAFEVQVLDGGSFKPVSSVGGEGRAQQFQDRLNNPGEYIHVDGTGSVLDKWAYRRFDLGANYFTAGKVYRVVNTNNVFHLGITNGEAATNGLYGYFSDYSLITAQLLLRKEIGNTMVPIPGKMIPVCHGQETKLDLGLDASFKARWESTQYFEPGFDETSMSPVVKPENDWTYKVKVWGLCDNVIEDEISLVVSSGINFGLGLSDKRCGAGIENLTITGIETARHLVVKQAVDGGPEAPLNVFRDPSTGKEVNYRPWDMTEPNPLRLSIPVNVEPYPAGPQYGEPRKYEFKVTASNGCEQSKTVSMLVYPEMVAPVVEATPNPDPLCGDGEVNLKLTNASAYPTGSSFQWALSDGTTPAGEGPHTVQLTNTGHQKQLAQQRVLVEDRHRVCRAAATVEQAVLPRVQGEIQLSPLEYCAPVERLRASLAGATGALDNNNTKWTLFQLEGGNTGANWMQQGDPVRGLMFSTTSKLQAHDELPQRYRLDVDIRGEGGCQAARSVEFVVNPSLAKPIIGTDFSDDKCAPLQLTATAGTVPAGARYQWRVAQGGVGGSAGQVYGAGTQASAGPLSLDLTLKHSEPTSVPHTIHLSLSNQYGCTSEGEATITVPPTVEARLSTGPREGCPAGYPLGDPSPRLSGLRSHFDASPSVTPGGSNTYRWYVDGAPVDKSQLSSWQSMGLLTQAELDAYDPKDAKGRALPPTLHYYFENTDPQNPRTYNVKLELTSSTGCQREVTTQVVVNPPVGLSFNAEVARVPSDPNAAPVYEPLSTSTRICPPVLLNLTAEGAPSYRWELPGGQTLEKDRVEGLRVDNPGQADLPWTVRLVGYNAQGCQRELEETYTVRREVKAAAQVTVVDACNPMAVEVENLSRPLTTDGTVSYQWTNGGAAKDEPLGDHSRRFTYTSPGPKQLSLKVTDVNSRCSDTYTHPLLTVPDYLAATIAPLKPAELNVCSPAKLTLTSTSQGADGVRWHFGDGTVSPLGSAPTITHEFRHGETTAQHYDVVLEALTLSGCSRKSLPMRVTVYPEVVPVSRLTQTGPCAPLELQLSNATQNATEFQWDFTPADGYGTQQAVKASSLGDQRVTLANSGENEWAKYTARFTAARVYSGAVTCRATLDLGEVRVPPALRLATEVTAPDASIPFSASPRAVCHGGEIKFTDRSRGGNLVREWDFGDGTSLVTSRRGESVTHRFENSASSRADATYTVRSRTYQEGLPAECAQTETLDVVVHPRVESRFTVSPGDRCAVPFAVSLASTSVGASPSSGHSTRLTWNFGDGTPTVGGPDLLGSTRHDYRNLNPTQSQTVTASLRVEQTHTATGLTCQDTRQEMVTVPPAIDAQLAVTPTEGCSPLEVTCDAKGSRGGTALKYAWDFGEGVFRENFGNGGQQVKHVYQNPTDTERKFTLRMRVTNEHGCTAEATREVRVAPSPEAFFTLAWKDQCTPYDMEVTNATRRATRYTWSFENAPDLQIPAGAAYDPFTVRLDNPNAAARTVKLRLEAAADWGALQCTSHHEETVRIPPRLVADFAVGNLSGCTPLTTTLTDRSQGATSYQWAIGGEKTLTAQSPGAITLANPDTQKEREVKVVLTVRNGEGCEATKEETLRIYPRVEADFVLPVSEGCTPLRVQLKNPSPSTAYSYRWELGPGRPVETTADPTEQVYENTLRPLEVLRVPLSLTVSLSQHPGCTASVTKDLTVYPAVLAGFTLPSLEGCHPLELTPKNTTESYQGRATYRWEIPGQDMKTEREPALRLLNPSHVDNLPLTVRMVATSEHGCEGVSEQAVTVFAQPRAGFKLKDGLNMHCAPYDAELISTAEGRSPRFVYDWGDGTPPLSMATGDPVQHSFTNPSEQQREYLLSQRVTSAEGCQARATQMLYIFPQVTAAFSLRPGESGCSPFVPEIENGSLNADQYLWEFGDGSVESHRAPSHRYVNSTTEDKHYPLTLTAQSQHGCKGTASTTVSVWATPRALFNMDPPSQTFPSATITLDNRSDPGAPGWSYRWDFGDGKGQSREHQPQYYTYDHWGPADQGFQFPVKLVAESPRCVDEIVKYAMVLPPEPEPQFRFDVAEGCPPLRVQMYNTSQYGNSYEWEFGDGLTSTDPEPTHVFTESGRVHVWLKVKGDGGEKKISKMIHVYQTPILDFEITPPEVSLPDARIRANQLSKWGKSYIWDFGDGSTSLEESPYHTYTEPGSYRVTLIGFSDQGCSDTLVRDGAVTVGGGGELRYPTAFRPRDGGPTGGYFEPRVSDMTNDLFRPFVTGSVREYKLIIYNRWGEQIYQSDELNKGWDGYFNGVKCPMGVYAWKAVGSYYDGTVFNLRGNVTVLQ